MFQNVRFFRFLNVQEVFFSYSMKGISLESVEEHSYLGVTLHGMSWKPHINNVCNKANRLLHGFSEEESAPMFI